METFLWGLASAAVVTLAWIAYSHPDVYGQISTPITLIGIAALWCAVSYHVGVLHSETAFSGAADISVPTAARDKIRSALKENEINGQWIGLLMGGVIYCYLLKALPMIGLVSREHQKSHRQ